MEKESFYVLDSNCFHVEECMQVQNMSVVGLKQRVEEEFMFFVVKLMTALLCSFFSFHSF